MSFYVALHKSDLTIQVNKDFLSFLAKKLSALYKLYTERGDSVKKTKLDFFKTAISALYLTMSVGQLVGWSVGPNKFQRVCFKCVSRCSKCFISCDSNLKLEHAWSSLGVTME